jgi:gas vesicle structural protein
MGSEAMGTCFPGLMQNPKEKGDFVMAMEKSMASASLAEVVDRILDKGVVVDAWARVSLVGIELLAVEARAVVAGVETYLKYAEAVGLTATA